MQVQIEIIDVNINRFIRGTESIKIIPYEDGESCGVYWNSAKDFQNNIKDLGIECFKNIEQFKGKLKQVGVKL